MLASRIFCKEAEEEEEKTKQNEILSIIHNMQ